MRFLVARGGVRLDRLIADEAGCGRRRARELLRAGMVRVDGAVAGAASLPGAGQVVEIDVPATTPVPHEPSEPVRILAAAGDVIALAKPAGLHTQLGRRGGSVAEFLQRCFAGMAEVGNRPEEAGTVHRLDQDTSGVLLAARSRAEYVRLRALFSGGLVRKEYLALVSGRAGTLDIDRPLAPRTTRVVPARRRDRARAARTTAQPLEAGPHWSLMHVTMRTGVRHQVRVHLAWAGHPLIGDALYGGPPSPVAGARGHLLHAWRVCVDGLIDVTAPVPERFLATLAELRRNA